MPTPRSDNMHRHACVEQQRLVCPPEIMKAQFGKPEFARTADKPASDGMRIA